MSDQRTGVGKGTDDDTAPVTGVPGAGGDEAVPTEGLAAAEGLAGEEAWEEVNRAWHYAGDPLMEYELDPDEVDGEDREWEDVIDYGPDPDDDYEGPDRYGHFGPMVN